MEWISVKNKWPPDRPILFIDKFNNICYGTCHVYGEVFQATDWLDENKSKKFDLFIEIPLIPNHLEANRYCKRCGELLNITSDMGYRSTLVAYTNGEDDNCKTRYYQCKNGHGARISIVNKNKATGWRGKEECFCCLKVEEWPEPPKE